MRRPRSHARARALEARVLEQGRQELVVPARSADVRPALGAVDEALRYTRPLVAGARPSMRFATRVREAEGPSAQPQHARQPVAERLPGRHLEIRPPRAVEVRVLADAHAEAGP